MGYGMEEDLGFLADMDDDQKRIDSGLLTDHEKMLDWLGVSSSEFNDESQNEQTRCLFLWNRFGRKEYNKLRA